MEMHVSQGSDRPLFAAESSTIDELLQAGEVTRAQIEAQIAVHQERATQLIRGQADDTSAADMTEWQQHYAAIDALYELLETFPADVATSDSDEIQEIESMAQLAELYASDAVFPRLGAQAVQDAHALLGSSTKVNEVVLIAQPGTEQTVDTALAIIPSHRRTVLEHPDLVRGPVIHQQEDGSLIHYRNGVAIWRTPTAEQE